MGTMCLAREPPLQEMLDTFLSLHWSPEQTCCHHLPKIHSCWRIPYQELLVSPLPRWP